MLCQRASEREMQNIRLILWYWRFCGIRLCCEIRKIIPFDVSGIIWNCGFLSFSEPSHDSVTLLHR